LVFDKLTSELDAVVDIERIGFGKVVEVDVERNEKTSGDKPGDQGNQFTSNMDRLSFD